MNPFLGLATIAAFNAVTLVVVAGAVGVIFEAFDYFAPSELWGTSRPFLTGFLAALYFGGVPALPLGVPGYYLLWRVGRATWLSACGLGAALGALVAFVEPALAAWGAGCGIVAAGLTHLAALRWLCPPSGPRQPPLYSPD
jgi:hypothetical protein